MGRSVRSKLGRMLREARGAAIESGATGVPIDEMHDIRAERRVKVRSQAREAAEVYNAANTRAKETGDPEDDAAAALALVNIRRVGRRDFLKGTAAALAAAALFKPKRSYAAGGQPTIAIVGGGLAGLRCAHQLWTKYGWKSTVYEAAGGVGGRCETKRDLWSNGLVAEMHGEFVSTEHASMFNLIKAFNLATDDCAANPAGTVDTYWTNGHRYTQAMLDADWQAWAWQFFNNDVKAVPWPQRYNSFLPLAQTYDNMNVVDWINKYQQGGITSDFGSLCFQNAVDEYGGDPYDQSALNHMFMLGYNDSANGRAYQSSTQPVIAGTDERWHVTNGNDQIVTGMVNQLPAGTIQTGQALIALAKNSNGTYTLTLKSGTKTSQVTVQSVVLALPFKTLRNVDLSKAGLSTLKTTAINTLGMGTSAKVVMQFNGAPWHASGFTGTTYQDNGFLSSGWQMVQSAAVGGYTGPTSLWTAYPGGTYTTQIVNSYNLTTSDGTPPVKLVNDLLAQLEPVFPGVTNAYGGKAWYDFGVLDQYLGGGYSYWRVGQYTAFSGYESVQEGKIHFAGEHTNPDFQGFMEGAVTSGERCASEVHQGG